MKKLFPTIVTTRRIEVPSEQFNLDELQALAESCLELGGFIQPPVLRRNGENYTIVTGHKQVAAAHLARLIDPENGAMLPVFIIEPETEAAILTKITPAPVETVETVETAPATPAPVALAPIVLLARKNLAQLKVIARQRGITPKGDKRSKATWLSALMAA